MKTKTNYYSNSLIGIPYEQFAKDEKSILKKFDSLFSQVTAKNVSESISQDTKLLEEINNAIEAFYSLPKLKDPIRAVTGNYFFVRNGMLTKAPGGSLLFGMFQPEFTQLESDSNKLNSNKIPLHYHKNVKIKFSIANFDGLIKKLTKTSQSILKDENIKKEIINLFINKFIDLLSISTKNNYVKFTINNLVDESLGEQYDNVMSLNENYNFFIKNYESAFNSGSSFSTLIPNYYCLKQFVTAEQVTPALEDIVSLGGKVKVTKETIASEEYYTTISNILSVPDVVLTQKLSSYVLDNEFVSNTNDLSTEMMPFVNEFSFYDSSKNTVSQFLSDNKLNYLATVNTHNYLNETQQFLNLNTISVSRTPIINLQMNNLRMLDTVVENKNFQTIDYLKVFDFDAGFKINQNEKTFYFSNSNNFDSLTKSSSIFMFLKLHNLVIDSLAQSSYASILNGNDLPTYCMSYSIDKFEQSIKKQTISLTRDNNQSVYKFNDSQIIYDKDYQYVFNLNNLINNVEYSFQNIRKGKENDILLDIELNYGAKIIKCEFGTFNTKMIDKPPISPDIKFYPFYGVNNKIKILLSSPSGRIVQKPITILPTDSQFFNKHKKNLFQRIVFESDDVINAVQVFRTTTEPYSYQDFARTSNFLVDFTNVSSVAYDDFVTPNTKYYYTFRTIDVHNQISNPSAVYEVQLIDNDGAIYPIIKEHIFKNKQDFSTSKAFKKYLQISPSVSQKLFDIDNGNIKFNEDQQLWGQKFKIRIKSKKSGKVIDLNVLFDKKEIKIN